MRVQEPTKEQTLLEHIKRRFEARRYLPPLVFAAIAIVYLIIASGFQDATSAEAPILYGRALLGLSILVFFLSFRTPANEKRKLVTSARKVDGGDWRRAIQIYGFIISLIGLVFAFGFYVGIPLFLFCFFKFVSKLSLIWSIALAAGFYAFTWFVFGWFLNLEVFSGYLLMNGIL